MPDGVSRELFERVRPSRDKPAVASTRMQRRPWGRLDIPLIGRQVNVPVLLGIGVSATGAVLTAASIVGGGEKADASLDSGVSVVPIVSSEAGRAPIPQAETEVYRKFAKERISGWMSFANLLPQDRKDLDIKISEMDLVLRKNPSFEGMKKVTRNRAQDLISFSHQYGIPPEVALAVNLIENGGSEFMTSPAGAKDDMQVVPNLLSEKLEKRGMSMEEFGRLSQDGQARIRREIGVSYLSDMYKLFGDWGLAVWAYHAGPGNVSSALNAYFKDTEGISIESGNYRDIVATRALTRGFNIEKLLSNSAVKRHVLSNLEDETELYPFKMIAAVLIINNEMPDLIEKILNSKK